MSHIVLDARLYRASTGGIGRYSRELIAHLAKLDSQNRYTLLLTPADKAELADLADNMRPLVTPITHFTTAEQLKLPALIHRLRTDLVHFLNFNHPLLYRGPFISTIHDLTMNLFPVGRQKSWWRRQIYLKVMDHAATAAATVIVPSKGVRQDVIDHLGAEPTRVKVIYEAAGPGLAGRPAPLRQLAELGIKRPFILFVSQWRPHKGLAPLVEAFGQISRQHPVQLVITGQPNRQFPELVQLVEQAKKHLPIITPGFVDDQLLEALYRQAELFVFPSWYEGFGLPPLEAMARGLPVAASDQSVMPEILGSAAAYFDPRNPDSIAKTVIALLGDRQRLKEMSEQGLAQAARYSWQEMAAEHLALYKRIIKQTGKTND